MNISGYAILKFEFGDEVAYAYDPSVPTAGNVTIHPSVINNTISEIGGKWDFTDGDNDFENATIYEWYINGTNAWRDPNLVSYWKLDSNTLDSAGSNNGNIIGSLGNYTGKIKRAYHFSNNSYIDLATYTRSGEISVSSWINFDTDSATLQTILDYAAVSFSLITSIDSVFFWPNSGGDVHIITGLNLNPSQWYHMGVTYNYGYNSTHGKGIFYLNGEAKQTFFGTNSNGTATGKSIGRYVDGNYFNGTIDEVMVYNKTLTSQEIGDLYNLTSYGQIAASGLSHTITNLSSRYYNLTGTNLTFGVIPYDGVDGYGAQVNSSTITVADVISPTVSNQLNYTNDGFNYTMSAQSSEAGSCTLYGNWSGSWTKNDTKSVTANTLFNFTSLNFTSQNTNYFWGMNCSDSSANIGWGTIYSFTTVDTIPPTISDQVNYTTNRLNYTMSVKSTESGSCTLYGNWSGSWAKNETKAVTAGARFNFTSLNFTSEGYNYLWNANCSDLSGNRRIGINISFTTADITPPIIYDQLNYTNDRINYTFSANVSETGQCSLFGDWGGSWRLNQSNSVIANQKWSANYSFTVQDSADPVISNQKNYTNDRINYNFSLTLAEEGTCTLYGNWSGSWGKNATSGLTASLPFNFTGIRFIASETNYLWRVNCSDTSNNPVTGNNISFTTADQIAPSVTNLVNYTNNRLDYLFSSQSSESGSCTLYGNWTGLWNKNKTVSVNANTLFNFTIVNFTNYGFNYLWGVNCSDTTGNNGQSNNVSFASLDTAAPNIVNQINYTNDRELYIFSANSSESGQCSLYGNWSGAWIKNSTVSNIGNELFNFTNIIFAVADQNYLWGINCSDNLGNSGFGSNYSFYSVDNTPPIISNQINYTNERINYTFSAQSNENGVCTLYGNWSGTWGKNISSSVLAGTVFNFTNINFITPGLHYFWGMNCSDWNQNLAWGANYSFVSVEINLPNFTYIKNYSATNSLGIIATRVIDDTGISACQLWTNITGSWSLNQTNNSVTNNTLFNFTALGKYQNLMWNIRCNDTYGNYRWLTDNIEGNILINSTISSTLSDYVLRDDFESGTIGSQVGAVQQGQAGWEVTGSYNKYQNINNDKSMEVSGGSSSSYACATIYPRDNNMTCKTEVYHNDSSSLYLYFIEGASTTCSGSTFAAGRISAPISNNPFVADGTGSESLSYTINTGELYNYYVTDDNSNNKISYYIEQISNTSNYINSSARTREYNTNSVRKLFISSHSADAYAYVGRVTCWNGTKANEPLIRIYSNYSATFGDFIAPTVSNQINYTNDQLNYTMSAKSSEDGSCSLYGNWSGSWTINQTLGVTANVLFNFTSINFSSGNSYIWGMNCSDSSINQGLGVNYTFSTFDSAGPSITNQRNYTLDRIIYNFSLTSSKTGQCSLGGNLFRYAKFFCLGD